MSKYLEPIQQELYLPLNLQLFAGDESEDDDEIEFEIEDDGDEEVELPEEDEGDEGDDEQEVSEGDGHQGADDEQDGEESDVDDQDAGTEEQQVKGKGKNETAAAVIAERKKWQAKLKELEQQATIAKRFMEQTGVTDIEEMNRRMDALESQRLQQSGVPVELADRMAKTERQLKDQERDIRRQRYAMEAEQLKADPFYADLDDYREELEELAERNGMTLRQVYMSEHGERRMKEREAEIEERVKSNSRKRSAKKVDTSPTGSNSNKNTRRVNLSADERAIAKAAGMTPEEYAKYKKR